jgi:AAA family ATP:ADP antiporter
MLSPRPAVDSSVLIAMICSGAVSAQFIAGKATRDALYLAHLDVTTLPVIVVLTAVVSILLVMGSSRSLRSIAPGTFVPATFALSAAFLLGSWLLLDWSPTLAAQAVYLQISGLGPMLGSGFWLIATERFDPHTARLNFGRIAGVGTITGLVAALITERIGATIGIEAMLPVLAILNLLCAWQIRRLAGPRVLTLHDKAMEVAPDLAATSPRSGLRVLAGAPYLRNLAALVLLGTVAATLADYVFKVQAVETFGRGDALLQFFALYYAAVSLVAFVVQSASAPLVLEKLGLAVTTATPSLALVLAGVGGLVFPGLGGALIARGAESTLRSSLFKTGYEIFFTPINSQDKRAAKSIIDVGFDRLGDAVGGGLIRLLIMLPSSIQYTALLGVAIVCSAVAVAVAQRLSRGYIHTLERSLLDRAVELELADVGDITTRTVMMRTMKPARAIVTRTQPQQQPQTQTETTTARVPTPIADPEVREIMALRSRNRDAVLQVLRQEEGLPASLIPHVIPLLAWDPVAEDAVRALRKVAEERVGQLVDALLDPNQPFASRRRLARVFSVCVSQRAVDGVLLGLEDLRFEVRFQCGRSLAAILEKNPKLRIDKERVFDVVRREVAVGRPVWESHRLLDTIDADSRSFVDEFLKDRAGQSLAHAFTLLSLVLPTAPLQIAYRGLHTDDPGLRGTALEYLEGVLPPDIRDRLWPFLSDRPRKSSDSRAREEILADLLRSNESIMLNLEELRRRTGTGPP